MTGNTAAEKALIKAVRALVKEGWSARMIQAYAYDEASRVSGGGE